MRYLKVIIPFGLVIAFFGLVGWGGALTTSPESYWGCTRYDQAIAALQSERNLSLSTEAKSALDAQIADVKAQKTEDTACASSPASSVASPTATTTTTTPTPSASATTTVTPSTSASAASWTAHYYFFDAGKASARTFGPAVDPAKAAEEFRTRMTVDPALLCGNGGLIVTGKDGGIDCVQSVLKSVGARDTYLNSVFSNIVSMSVRDIKAGAVAGVYMVEVGGVPRIISDPAVPYVHSYRVLEVVTKDGRILSFRLECGFQWVGIAPTTGTPYTPAPACVNGNMRDENGSCGSTTKLVDACRLVGGTWRIVRDVPGEAGDQPVSSLKCKPVTTPPPTTSTPTPSCPPGQHGTPPVCKDDPSRDPASQGNVPTQVQGMAPAVTQPASEPSVTRPAATSTYTAPASPAAPTTARTTSAPPVEVPSTTATGTVADG